MTVLGLINAPKTFGGRDTAEHLGERTCSSNVIDKFTAATVNSDRRLSLGIRLSSHHHHRLCGLAARCV